MADAIAEKDELFARMVHPVSIVDKDGKTIPNVTILDLCTFCFTMGSARPELELIRSDLCRAKKLERKFARILASPESAAKLDHIQIVDPASLQKPLPEFRIGLFRDLATQRTKKNVVDYILKVAKKLDFERCIPHSDRQNKW
jgi:hypothetical protein